MLNQFFYDKMTNLNFSSPDPVKHLSSQMEGLQISNAGSNVVKTNYFLKFPAHICHQVQEKWICQLENVKLKVCER